MSGAPYALPNAAEYYPGAVVRPPGRPAPLNLPNVSPNDLRNNRNRPTAPVMEQPTAPNRPSQRPVGQPLTQRMPGLQRNPVLNIPNVSPHDLRNNRNPVTPSPQQAGTPRVNPPSSASPGGGKTPRPRGGLGRAARGAGGALGALGALGGLMDLAQAPELARDIADNARSPLTDPPGTPGSTPSPRPSGGFPGSGSPTASPGSYPDGSPDLRRGRPMVVRVWIKDPGEPAWVADTHILGAPISFETYGREPVNASVERLGSRIHHTALVDGQLVDAVLDGGIGNSPIGREYYATAHPFNSEPPPNPEPVPAPGGSPSPSPQRPGPQPQLAPPVGSPPPNARPTPDRPNSPQTPGSPQNPTHPSPPASPFPPFFPMPAPATPPGARPNPPAPTPRAPSPNPFQGIPSTRGTPQGSASSFGQPRTSTITSGGTPTAQPPDPRNLQCRYSPHLDQQIAVLSNLISNTQLVEINNKLGPQLPGGIGGRLQGITQALKIPQILSVFNTFILLHNAQMLSSAIAQTLFSAVDNVMALTGNQIKDAEGNEISFSEAVGTTFENLANAVIGEEQVDRIQSIWVKFNRIYQATANIVYSLQSISWSILEGLETVGNYVAQIGNAARKFGVVAQNAFGWMNPNLDFSQSRLFNALNNAQEAAEALEVVSGELLNVQQTAAELSTQSNELKKAIQDLTDEGEPVPRGAYPYAQETPETTSVMIKESESAGASTNFVQPIPPESTQPQPPTEP